MGGRSSEVGGDVGIWIVRNGLISSYLLGYRRDSRQMMNFWSLWGCQSMLFYRS